MRRNALFFITLTLVTACESGGRSGKKDASSSGDAQSGGDASDGLSDGSTDGSSDGSSDGSTDGSSDGSTDGSSDGSGTCVDETYSETLPPKDAPLTDLLADYSSSAASDFIMKVLERRYPIGKYLVEGGLEYDGINCIEQFLGKKTTGKDVIGQLSTIVHECGHTFDIDQSSFSGATYVIRDDLRLECPGASYAGQNASFARSLINADPYASERPPCNGGGSGCDFYADVYLDGDPENAQFEGGDQGFDTVIEEAVQYVNSLATGYAFSDQYDGMVSERDGILTFLWYMERYLRLARTEHPEVHAFLLGNECWRDAILTVWGRAWLYLDATANNPKLGLDDDALEKLVKTPELLDEIEAVRVASGCR